MRTGILRWTLFALVGGVVSGCGSEAGGVGPVSPPAPSLPGTYSLVSFDGVDIPGSLPPQQLTGFTCHVNILSGSLTLRADDTYSRWRTDTIYCIDDRGIETLSDPNTFEVKGAYRHAGRSLEFLDDEGRVGATGLWDGDAVQVTGGTPQDPLVRRYVR